MEISILDIDSTNEEIYSRNTTEEAREKGFIGFENSVNLIKSGFLATFHDSNGEYITSCNNAKLYESMYGWQFVTVSILEL